MRKPDTQGRINRKWRAFSSMVQYFCLKVRQFSINVIAVNAFQGRLKLPFKDLHFLALQHWMMLLGLGQDDTFWVGVGSE